MPRHRFVPHTFYDTPSVPFRDAEEAWFWYIRCQRAREEGVRFEGAPGAMARPCDPDDVYRAVVGLASRRRIGIGHLRVLNDFGRRERPPDPRRDDEQRPARLWDEALDRLSTVLRKKGIVE